MSLFCSTENLPSKIFSFFKAVNTNNRREGGGRGGGGNIARGEGGGVVTTIKLFSKCLSTKVI